MHPRICTAAFLAFVVSMAFGTSTLRAQQPKESLDLPYHAIGDSQDEEDAPETVFFYGLTMEGDGFFYTVDKSGSMAQGELPIAKREISRNISEFSEKTQFAVNFFATNVDKFPAGLQPVDASPGQKQSALAFINSVQTASGSCCQKGILEALRYANTSAVRRKVVVYVGDGGGTCGGDEDQYHQQTLQAVQAANYQRVTINTIGVLMHTQQAKHEQFLKTLAAQHGGTYRRIN
jgi:hypothetical protein